MPRSILIPAMSQPSPSEQPQPKSRKRRRKRRRSKALAQIRSFEKADWQRALGGLKQSVPGLGVSLAFHVVVLFILTWIVFQTSEQTIAPLELGWSTIVESDAQEPAETPEIVQPIVIPSISMNKNREASQATVQTPAEAPTTPKNQQGKPSLNLVDVSNSLRLRKQKRGEADGTGQGAKKGTGREAIQDGLRWIVKQQESDGRWRLNGDYADAGTIETDTGATALALLALLGDGQTHIDGDYQVEVRKGLEWLRQTQRANGDFFDIEEQGREAHFYSHAQATIAYCEALALTEDESLRGPAEKGVQFLIDSQNQLLGGWKYRPLNDDGIGDLSVTGWALMALHSARMANINVDLNTFALAERFLDSVQERPSTPAFYKYRPDFPVNGPQRLSMTAEGLLCRQWLGWPKDHLPMQVGAQFLNNQQNTPEWKPNRRNVYAWYYTAQTLHNLGDKNWDQWFQHVLPLIVKGQTSGGKDKGSWHPLRPLGAPHERSREAGRLYLTVMCVLILETPYRHAPLYE